MTTVPLNVTSLQPLALNRFEIRCKSPIKLHWCARLVDGGKNFGDWISPELCRELSGRDVEYAPACDADLIAVGSVLHRVPAHFWNRTVDVWGAGLMHERKHGWAIHRYHAVRGELTRHFIGAPKLATLGDPGLLVGRLFPAFAEATKRWDVGLVPHHIDRASPLIERLTARVKGLRVLNILGGIGEFLAELAACRFVLSSSLHGLVAADAFRIPNAWINISDCVLGAGFKFRDYYSVFDLPRPTVRPIEDVNAEFIERTTAEYRRAEVERIQENLIRAFPYPA